MNVTIDAEVPQVEAKGVDEHPDLTADVKCNLYAGLPQRLGPHTVEGSDDVCAAWTDAWIPKITT